MSSANDLSDRVDVLMDAPSGWSRHPAFAALHLAPPHAPNAVDNSLGVHLSFDGRGLGLTCPWVRAYYDGRDTTRETAEDSALGRVPEPDPPEVETKKRACPQLYVDRVR